MYGETPRAKMEKLDKAPPPRRSIRATALAPFNALLSSPVAVTPGTVIAAPIRITKRIIIVKKIRLTMSLFLKIEAIFFIRLDHLCFATGINDCFFGTLGEFIGLN